MTISRRESFKALTGSIAALAFASKMSAAKPLNAAASDASGAVCSSCGADLTKIEAMLSDSLGSAALAAWASRPTPLVATVRAGNGLPVGYVGSSNGGLSFAVGDLAVDSLPQIGIMRHYNSLNTTDSGLGLGWSLELDDVVEVSGGNAVLRTGGGETVPMVLDSSSNTFEPVNPALTHHRPLRMAENGTLREVMMGGDVTRVYCQIDGVYHLTSIEYGQLGNVTITIVNGKVSSIANAAARSSLTLAWSQGDTPRLLSVSDSTGRSVTYSYEGKTLSAFTDAAGATWVYNYSGNQLTAIVDPEGTPLLRATYASQRVSSFTDLDGQTQLSYSQGSSGMRTAVTLPTGEVSIFSHNSLGQILSVSGNGERPLTFAYDGRGRLVAAQGPGIADQYGYDDSNRLVWRSGRAPRTSQAHVMRWGFDASDRLTSHTVDGKTTTFSYDSLGNLTQASGQDVRKAYTASYKAGHVVRLTNSSQTMTLEYDALGQLTASTNPAGKTEYGRDQHGWISSRRLPSGYQIDFTRNAVGQIIRRKDSQGRDLSYSRDKSGALVKVTANDGSWIAAARDDQGRITSLTNSSGQSRKFSYDSHSRMTAYTDATGSTFSVEYGADGMPSRMAQKGGNRVITQGFVANVPTAGGSASEAYSDGWKDPAGSHTLLASFDDGFAEKLGMPRVSAGQKGVEQSIEGATPDCGLPQCPPGSNGPQSAQCIACQSHAHSVLVACLAAASAAEAAADVACSQKPANQQKACYATAAAVYAAAVTYCDVNYNSAMSTCTYGVCACPTTCTGAPGCP